MTSEKSDDDGGRLKAYAKKFSSKILLGAGALATISVTVALIGSIVSYSHNSTSWNAIGNFISIAINIGGDGSSKENDNSNPSVASSEANHSKENIQQTVQGCSLLDSAVPCDMKHDSEVISNVSNCESDAVLNYLGGTPFVDTISPGISFESDADNSSKCKVTFPVSVEGSIKGRWQEPSLHQLPELRSCFNPDRADQIVGCNEPHTGEVVYSQSNSDEADLSCDMKAVDYIDADEEKWQDTLKTEGIEYNGSWLCVARTRNDNLLDGTLRSLRAQKIKTKPRQ